MPSQLQVRSEPIAIVGSACRFPGDATSPAKLWKLLKEPRDVLTEIPESRFNSKAFYQPDGSHHGTTNVRHSYVLSDDHRLFDAQFFGTKPIEANSIDPQQRLLLETTYECLESAGIPMEKLQGSNTGVYVGLMTNDYADLLGRDVQSLPTYFASGTARSILSNRVSYFFDWHGPSMTIDTACSSSLIALHQAVLSLRNGESNVAVAAGTNLLLGPEQYIAESKLKMLSPSGRSRMWDKDADGYARGDGIAAVVLKTLSAALADGDHIECIVRETGINQDGRTKGITMPNPVAQANLIHETYSKAGLDLSKASDRPQYFEAHGTGTPAGDPVEAEAISTAFYGSKANYRRTDAQEPPLYVGSIKTVIGHTEGTAGLAAVLKASLALQHGVIPPNLLLNELNPAVRPFYAHLEILETARQWPKIPTETPRRASVNSFGFGGANAHAILESFPQNTVAHGPSTTVLTPFNFSANSERSLLATLQEYSAFLEAHPQVDLRNLSWTLNCRRSTLPYRLSLVGSNASDLAMSLDNAVLLPSDVLPASQTSSVKQPRLLGIFTGQGAQWARMGAELILSSPMAAKCISNLDLALHTLPEKDRPSWSLRDEIVKDAHSSRIGEAFFSQTLSTAVQIMLVQLLRTAGIQFTAVVGHSSGEIAAAYAAGYLCADDAIRIAYHRGWSLRHARDCNGVRGAMMAVGTSLEDAEELCDMPSLEGRICVAASNSSVSVTLSGDADAIEEANDIFEDEKKFARLLKVDKAYHSHHMLPCAAPYIAAMQRCAITIQPRSESRTAWISSVYGKDIKDVNDSLTDTYWSNNMINPVMFSQAVSHAVAALGPFDMAVEVGPHPALKGPALQTIQEISGVSLPYTGTLSRGKGDKKSFASSLGALWAHLGERAVDFARFEREAVGDGRQPSLLKGLPSYSWDHDRVYWHESRISSTLRAGSGEFHPLLGMKCPDGTNRELRWRNYLHPREIPWLSHHQVQGQIVFPAAGYISALTECVVQQYGLESIQLIDLQHIIIGQALVLEENLGVEVLFTLTVSEKAKNFVRASYSCYSSGSKGGSSMVLHASAQVHVILGDSDPEALPQRSEIQDSYLRLEEDRFYNFVSELGFGYTGPFRALTELTRKMDQATGKIIVPASDESDKTLLIHPAPLDAAIQSVMLAYSFPGDGRLRTLYLPTKIDRLRINPSYCVNKAGPGTLLPFFASVAEARFAELSGDVDIYSPDGKHTLVQLQGLHTTPLTPLSAATDVPMFTEMTWAPEEPTGGDQDISKDLVNEYCALALDLERIACFYLKQLHTSISHSERSQIKNHYSHLLAFADHCTALVKSGDHPISKQEWTNDTEEGISHLLQRLNGTIDCNIMRSVGENLPAIVRGKTNILDILMQENMLSRFYAATVGIKPYLSELGRIAGQIGNRFPHINVIEIGAGAGEATECVLPELDTAFGSYTYTDFMDSWLESAQDRFQTYQAKMVFKVLDIDKDVIEQGYGAQSYDLVIASLALYATENIQRTLSNIRRLLKPGGYLLILELTDPDLMRFAVILGALPGWWLGHGEGRTLSPCVCPDKWNELMKESGFSGIDASALHDPARLMPFSVMLTQAVDLRVKFLRDPIGMGHQKLDVESLTCIGGTSSLASAMIDTVKNAVGRHFATIRCYDELADIGPDELPFMGTVLCLTELDGPALLKMGARTLKGFQELFSQSKNVLWVGHGAQGENPEGNLFRGIQRTIAMEMRHLRIQSLNFASLHLADAGLVAKKLLQLVATDVWEQSDQLLGMLWYTEPELSFQDGKIFIPRLRLSPERNDRYNSMKRLIVDAVDRKSTTVTISRAGDYQVLETEILKPRPFGDRIEIQVTKCLLRSVMVTETDYMFLVMGRELEGNGYVVAFAESLASRIYVPPSWIFKCGKSENLAVRSLLGLYVHFLVQSLCKTMLPGTTLAVLEPDFSIAAALTHHAPQAGVQIVLLTTKDTHCSFPWVHIHRHTTRRELSNKIPRNTSRLFHAGGASDVVSLLKELLPVGCQFENEDDLTRDASQPSVSIDVNRLASQLQKTWPAADGDQLPVNLNRLPQVSLRDLINTQGSVPQSLITLDHSKLPVQVKPATQLLQFSKNKTYWLVGLTGGLGLSLCQWMAKQGARYIALSSRNPKVDENWIHQMAANGCIVKVFANDITNRSSVHNTHRQIIDAMPPIGGVAQGAMVLQDTMFLDLDLPRFNAVLQPKVQGSILLDELFSENSLDFMIFFSSMASLTGNPGQAAYNAANMYMASLAAQRQKRGLAGQAINIGAIVGNGYVTRELNMGQQSYLYKVGHTWMSEQDFQEIFAEGILSCLQRRIAVEICSGLRIDDDESKDWISNPMFQHLVFKSNTVIEGDKKGKSSVMVKPRLLEATSNTEVMEVLQDGFSLKLQSALQIDPNKPILELSPDELGVDSLNAVDFRSWFLKELGVDVPVLKIFNAGSIRDLLVFVASCLPSSLIPNVKQNALDKSSESPASQPSSQLVSTTPPSSLQSPLSDPQIHDTDEVKTFHLEYISSANHAGSASSASIKTRDSGSDQDEHRSSLTSFESDSEMSEKGLIQRVAPMSFGQSRFWFLKSLVQDPTAFNVTPTFELKGRLDVEKFSCAVDLIGQLHESLRTFFFTDEKKRHMQGVWAKSSLRLEHDYVSNVAEVDLATQQMQRYVFDIHEGEVMRIRLLTLAPDHHCLLFGYHHINMDGVSFENIWMELEEAYEGRATPRQSLQYPDFAARQLREYEDGGWTDDLEYWRSEFAVLPQPIPLLPFSLRLARPMVSKYASRRAHVRLGPRLSTEIENCCRMFKVTPFHFHLAMWQILLHRHLNVESLCIGLADSNRTDADILQSVGMFLNLLPMKFSLDSSQSFGEALKEAKRVSQKSLAHSRVPFDVILSELNVPRSASHSPLFQAFYNYRPRTEVSRQFCGCQAEGTLLSTGETSHDLHLDIINLGNGDTLVHLLVQEELYNIEHAEIILRSYENLLRAFTRNPATKVSWPPLFSETEIEKSIVAGRGPEAKNQWSSTLVHRIDDMTELYPAHIALKDPNTWHTYSQMRDRVVVIAAELIGRGVASGTRVGVFQSASAGWICSLLAIWRIGAVYLPLDKKVGLERLSLMIAASRPLIILTDSTTAADFVFLRSTAESLDIGNIASTPGTLPPNLATANQTAIIIYTSGSTGVPKGISLSHSSHLHHIQACSRAWDFPLGKETVLHQSSYAWDMSMYQILMSLCHAATLIIAPNSTRGDPVAITDLIESEKVTTVLATPTEYLAWFRHGRESLHRSSLALAVSGGEPATAGLVKGFQSLGKPELRLFNVYGPAEVTLACSTAEIPYTQLNSDLLDSCLGLSTLSNYSVCIVDENMQPLPIGIPGEVMVGGAGIAEGYLDPGLTNESFLFDSHASPFFKSQGWTTVHRTGDRGRLTQDGRLVLFGRIKGDNQVKLGGIRINVEEIEAAIVQSSQGVISQVIVSARSATGDPAGGSFLVAFVVLANAEASESDSRLLEGLPTSLPLPQYMRPAMLVPVPALPQNTSGKVDRFAVSNIPISRPLPRMIDNGVLTPIEESLLTLWQEVIPQEIIDFKTIDSRSDFFHVGGSSLSLADLQAHIKDQFSVTVPLYQLFEASTLQGMAARIENISSTQSLSPINWDEELESLLAELPARSDDEPPNKPSGTGVVILTGSTGFIGKEILRQLVKDDRVRAIYCLAVRKPLVQLPAIFANPKVHVYHGNLESPQLGLSDTDATSIFQSADIIIHNGADVSFMKSYQSLKLTNVASTVELVKLALSRRVPFHFISSASVTRFACTESYGEVSVASFPPPAIPKDGYATAKWVSEVYLERVNQSWGLPVWVHRPSSVTGSGAPELDLMSNVLRYCQENKKIPKSEAWNGVFDFVSVESAAAQIINAVQISGDSSAADGRTRFVYESGEIQVGQHEVQSMMETGAGEQFETVPLLSWVDAAEAAGMSALLGVYLRQAAGGQILLPRLVKGSGKDVV